ncbi:MAG: hypothetical protein Aureis2KO_13120 [Aureisphaera sp.]
MTRALLFYTFLFLGVGLSAQVANQPDDLVVCDDNFDGFAEFDLTFTEAQILGSQSPSDFIISFYETQADADMGINAIFIPTSYINLSNPQAIYARLESLLNGNFDTTSFNLIVQPQPSPITPTPLIECDDDGDGFADFDLNSKDVEIAGGEPNLIISYHLTLIDAELNQLPLASPYTNSVPFLEILYVRVESSITGCFAIVELELVVWADCPFIDVDPEPIFVNEGDGDGLAIFDLTANEALMLGSQDPTLFAFTYYESFGDSDAGINPIPTPMAYQNIANPQTIYVRMTNNDNGSFVLTDFEIETDGVLGLTDVDKFAFVVYPNPATDLIQINTTQELSNLEIHVFDIKGSILITTQNKQSIDVSGLPSGMYFIRINVQGSELVKPLVKQ